MKYFQNIKAKLRKSVNFPSTIKSVGWMMKNFQFTAMNITDIYEGKLDKTRYWLCWVHQCSVILMIIMGTAILKSDTLYQLLVDENYFPKNTKQLLGLLLGLTILACVLRYDYLDGQRKSGLSFYKLFL